MNKKYIEREAAMAAVVKAIAKGHSAFNAIVELPAADVVPVVLCKDCRYSYDSVGGWCCSHGICVDCVVREDFFCADGKRKDDDGD